MHDSGEEEEKPTDSLEKRESPCERGGDLQPERSCTSTGKGVGEGGWKGEAFVRDRGEFMNKNRYLRAGEGRRRSRSLGKGKWSGDP